MSTRIQRKTKEAVGKENIFLKLLRPLLWYLSKAVIMLKQDKAITLRMYIWKVKPMLEEFSLVTSHWNRKSRITWTISSPKFSNTISKRIRSYCKHVMFCLYNYFSRLFQSYQ